MIAYHLYLHRGSPPPSSSTPASPYSSKAYSIQRQVSRSLAHSRLARILSASWGNAHMTQVAWRRPQLRRRHITFYSSLRRQFA
eukprot:scaffold305597_cov24-Tisochrysis_lutea.AAC.1